MHLPVSPAGSSAPAHSSWWLPPVSLLSPMGRTVGLTELAVVLTERVYTNINSCYDYIINYTLHNTVKDETGKRVDLV